MLDLRRRIQGLGCVVTAAGNPSTRLTHGGLTMFKGLYRTPVFGRCSTPTWGTPCYGNMGISRIYFGLLGSLSCLWRLQQKRTAKDSWRFYLLEGIREKGSILYRVQKKIIFNYCLRTPNQMMRHNRKITPSAQDKKPSHPSDSRLRRWSYF